MSNVLANSFKSSAQAVAFSRGMSPERMAERSEAYATKEQRDQQLQTLKATKPTAQDHALMAEEQTLKLQNALEVQKQMLLENNKRTTFNAYERYDADGDVRHINTMLNDLSKTGSKLYGKIARVDKLTKEDKPMLDQMGFSQQLQDQMLNNPELNKSYVKITQKDGTVTFGDLDALKGVTGYNDYADAKEVTRQKTAREIEMISALGYDANPEGREVFRRVRAALGNDVDPKSPEFQNAYTAELDKQKEQELLYRGRSYRPENDTEKEAEAKRRLRAQGILEGDPGYDAAYSEEMTNINAEWSRPSAMRNMEGAEAATVELEEEGFWEADVNSMTPRERSKWENKIRRIEQLSGAELSVADRTNLERIQRLTSLGNLAGNLTDEQTGVIDSVLRSAKKYIFDEVDGVSATAAYSAYRNLVQHALYGATLAPTEAENFIKQFGSLTQQRGPVLVQLRTTMQEILDTYEAIARTNNPMVMQWRTGKTEAELMDVMESLDERIQMIDNATKNMPVSTVNPPVKAVPGATISPENRAKLDKLSGKTP